MQEQDTRPIMVAIKCITYNHEPYIRQCLEGFVMQKTNFRFVAIVHDDASTDGTADIIREFEEKYPDIIKPIYETENQYSKRDGSLGRIMNEATNATGAKYIALCEGDDYWIDPLKLQKQVDFLEGNPEYGLVYTKAKVYNQELRSFSYNTIGNDYSNYEDLLLYNPIVTMTTCFRQEYIEGYRQMPKPSKQWLMGDYPLWLYIAAKTKIKFFPEVTGVYRLLKDSASHTRDFNRRKQFSLSRYEIQKHFAEFYHYDFMIPHISRNIVKTILLNSIIYNHSISNSNLNNIYRIKLRDYDLLGLYLISKMSFIRFLAMWCYKIRNITKYKRIN